MSLLFPIFLITPEDEEGLGTLSAIPILFFLLTAKLFVVQDLVPLDFQFQVSGQVSIKKVVHIYLSMLLSRY